VSYLLDDEDYYRKKSEDHFAELIREWQSSRGRITWEESAQESIQEQSIPEESTQGRRAWDGVTGIGESLDSP
jgi:hypothetical protein